MEVIVPINEAQMAIDASNSNTGADAKLLTDGEPIPVLLEGGIEQQKQQEDSGVVTTESQTSAPISDVYGGDNPNHGDSASNNQNISSLIEQQERTFQLQEEARRERIRQQLLDKSKASPSYYSNSTKEYLLLQYIENFNRQYKQLYPGRKDLGFIQQNEFGVPKFVCTTIRPTQLPFKQLYDYRSCAEFVSDFIQYKPLRPAHDLPKGLFSPTYTIAMQHGNSFDMSTLLVSMLTGVGYDAYVVSGYALKQITELDQTMTNASELKEYVPNHFMPKIQTDEKKLDVSALNQKYRVKQPKQLNSAFLMKQEDRLKSILVQQEKRAQELENIAPPPLQDDELKGLRIHAWVLVLPGKREVSEPFFIESSTGQIYDCETDMYLGLESVWSSSNFWVNMQICYDGLKGVSFDLGDTMKWEFVLLDNTLPGGRRRTKDEPEMEAVEEEEDEKLGQTEIVDMPISWVDRLSVTLEQFESKCPTGGKATQFRNAKSEVFADYHRSDGMIRRVVFNENDKSFANVTVETFANRKDKLFQRVRLRDLIHEFFHPGRSHGLKEHVMISGVTKTMEFYGSARPDGLFKRTDEPRKIIYEFDDREDGMVYRSITYETSGENELTTRGQMLKMTEKFLNNPNIPADMNYAKKTYFLKDERIRVVFHLGPGHIIPSLREFRKPPSDQKGQNLDLIQNFVIDPFAKPVKEQHMFSQLLDLYRTEQAFLQAIKNYERELSEILQLRVTEEQELCLSISIYDTIRSDNKLPEAAENSNNHEVAKIGGSGGSGEEKAPEVDYLSPFLINIEHPKNMTKDEAVLAKDTCLKSLRERLVEKANIIQSRLDETTEAFQQRQIHYSKNADSMSMEETEEYVQFCNDALFKIHILEKRLAKHKESAPDRYIELDARLRSDPRLSSAFLSSPI